MNNISPQAYVDPKAKIGNNVTIYPFAYIEGDVEIGDDCVIYPYVSIMNGTRLGRGNKVYQNTVLGAEPQDFNYKGEITALEIGDENIIRENVVINRATYATGKTHIGNRNFLMRVCISVTTPTCTTIVCLVMVPRSLATARYTVASSSHQA